MPRKVVAKIALVVWVLVWLLFLIRPYFKNNLLKEYSHLLTLSVDGKRAYIVGEEFYKFIKFCGESLTPPATYSLIGFNEGDLEHRRAVYYLYPNIARRQAPEFLLVFKVRGFSRDGYMIFKMLDDEKYILKKVH